jgi:hypothetical protein
MNSVLRDFASTFNILNIPHNDIKRSLVWEILLIIYDLNYTPGKFMYLHAELVNLLVEKYHKTTLSDKKLVLLSYYNIFKTDYELTHNYYYFGQEKYIRTALEKYRHPDHVVNYINNGETGVSPIGKGLYKIRLEIFQPFFASQLDIEMGKAITIYEKFTNEEYLTEHNEELINFINKLSGFFNSVGNIYHNYEIIENEKIDYYKTAKGIFYTFKDYYEEFLKSYNNQNN